jgi:hypothetical protein
VADRDDETQPASAATSALRGSSGGSSGNTSMIFGHLPDRLFMVFSRANRALYAACVLALYRAFYRSPDAIDILKPEWLAEIRDVCAQNPQLVTDMGDDLEDGEEVPTDDDRRASIIYRSLLKNGWLREKRKQLRVSVEMPTAAILLCETLDRIDRNISESIAGVISTISATMDAIKANAGRNAHALREARRSAESFLRRLRAIRSSLDEIDELIMGAKDLNERLTNFIDIFVGKLVIQDFKAVMTSNHPYRRRFEIMSAIAAVRSDPQKVSDAARTIFDAGNAKSIDDAEQGFRGDLSWLHGCFDKIDALFETITDHRSTLEGRLRNTIKYIDRSSPERAAKMVHAAQAALALRNEIQADGEDPDEVEFSLIPLLERHGIWSADMLAQPVEARPEPEARPVSKRKEPPEVALLRQLKRDYERRFEPQIPLIRKWLSERIEPGASMRASQVTITTLTDFLMLDAVRLLAIGGRYGGDSAIAGLPEWTARAAEGLRSDEWATFADFEIARKANGRPQAQKD